MAILEFNLLGGAEIKRNGRVLVGIRSQKARALLYYLATTGQAHSRTVLAGLLWGDLPEASARRNLRKTLTRLRQFVNNWLLITRQTVSLRSDVDVRVDVMQFQRLTAPQTSKDDWQFAVALYRGDFLDGFYVRHAPEFEIWLLGQRSRLRDMAVTCLQQLADTLAGEREDVQAISYTKRLLELEPWREESHRLLMTLYARSGQVASAISQYETCCQILAVDLGIEPDRETQQLFREICDSQRQVQTPTPSNLPLPATAFIGREAELDELMTYLRNPDVRLLTILGIGGAGKTRLALALAWQLADDDFPDGRYFISFEALHFSDSSNEETVQSTIAVHMLTSMKITVAPKEAPWGQLSRHLRGHHLLLILDNFETLLLPNVAPMVGKLVQEILTWSAQSKLLLTSRQPIYLRAEWIYDIDGLPVPATVEGKTNQTGSVQLFNETARRLSRHFDAEAEWTAVHKICRLLDGLPLGIELAASLIRQKQCSEIASQIEQNLASVTGKWRDLPPRQRSLRATFEYTWRLLTKPEQQLLAMLAYMRRGFSDEAARAIAGNLIQLLNNLGLMSLVKIRDERFYLHEVVLEFARQKLEDVPEWLNLAAAQHTQFFLNQITGIEDGLETGDDYPMCQALRPDLENIRAAWRWAIEQGEAERLNKAARGLMLFFHNMGWLAEGMTLLQEAVSALQSQQKQPLSTLINCLLQQSLLSAFGTDLTKTAELAHLSTHYLEILAKQKSDSDILFLQAQQQFLQGYIAHGNADWSVARTHLTQAAASFHRLNRTYDEARAYFVIGNGWMGERCWQKVVETCEKVIALCQKRGNLRLEAKTLATIAVACSSDNELEKARMCREQAKELWAKVNWPIRDEVVWMGMAADQALNAGFLDEAAMYIEQAIPLVVQSGSRFYEDWNQIQQGHLLLQLGEYEKAMDHYNRARACATAAEKPPMIAFALICLCLLHYRWGNATRLAQNAQALAVVTAQVDGDYYAARADSWTGLSMLASNRANEAEHSFLQALEATTDEVCLCEARWGLMLCYQQQGNQMAAYDTAVTLIESSLFEKLPMMVTEILSPFQIYYDCWQALLPVDHRQAEKVLHIASHHLRNWLHRIKNQKWKDAYLQEATLQGSFPLNRIQKVKFSSTISIGC